jgi:hypothetical protein
VSSIGFVLPHVFATQSFGPTAYVPDQTTTSAAQALTWTPVTSPTSNQLLSVSCISASDCWAVGSSGTIVQWTGSSWVTVTNPSPASDSILNSVSCISASDCWAVYDDPTVFVQWTGSSWRTVTSPTRHDIYGVFCVSASDCWAVGDEYTIVQWTGSSWVNVTSPSFQLRSVFCVSVSDCWAVGWGPSGAISQFTGSSWTNVPSPLGTSVYYDSTYLSIYCVNANDCWAVGFSDTNGGAIGRIVQWTGSSWVNVTSPTSNPLRSVSCISASDCWAVGGDVPGPPESPQGTIVQWNGFSWATVATPTTNYLNSVFCVSSSDCWAVGSGGTIVHGEPTSSCTYDMSGSFISEVESDSCFQYQTSNVFSSSFQLSGV